MSERRNSLPEERLEEECGLSSIFYHNSSKLISFRVDDLDVNGIVSIVVWSRFIFNVYFMHGRMYAFSQSSTVIA